MQVNLTPHQTPACLLGQVDLMGSAQVYLQRGKFLLALQAVRKGIALAGQSHPQVHHMAVQLCQRAQSQQQVSTPAEWGLLRDRGVIVCVTGSSAVSARSYLLQRKCFDDDSYVSSVRQAMSARSQGRKQAGSVSHHGQWV